MYGIIEGIVALLALSGAIYLTVNKKKIAEETERRRKERESKNS